MHLLVFRSMLLLSCLLGSAATFAQETSKTVSRCGVENVYTLASNAQDAMDACEGVLKALSFFSNHRLYLTGVVLLEISPRLPKIAPPMAAGIFSPVEKRIHILSFDEFRKFKTWFRLPINREIYQSLSSHEMAHAISNMHFKISKPSLQAKEYLAYVAMFASMSSPLRKRALLALPGTGFDNEYQISPVLYMFDPMLFGAQAYRHYLKQQNPTVFIHAILTGTALIDWELLY